MERVRYTAQRGISLRRIFTFVLAAFVSVLLATSVASHPTSAQSGDAQWKGESIIYSGKQYFPAGNAGASDSRGFPEGTIVYQAIEDQNGSSTTRQAHIIYFAPGTSPPTATSANYTLFDLTGQNQYSNARNQRAVTVVPSGQSTSGAASSCSVDGVGWIVCPVTVFLAEAMDNVYNLVADFVEVRPLSVNDTNSPLYIAWNVMRSIANVAFIIAFLVIIYSQLTGAGVSNYGLKKLLPRLIVAAILVNLSFYIAAIAVDASNIAGYSLQQIMISIRENTFAITNDTLQLQEDSNPWLAIAEFVLSGGAIVGGLGALSAATAGSAVSGIYLLLPLLLGFVLTILFVLLLLAARQAIIIILIVIAPLAFVANLLPNTEKWFDKWRDLFMTMLIFFPAFSLVFGGSQLAGGIIVQNATNFIMIIFGLAVQVAPLIITPLLIKLSGGLLGRIAGIMNDPRKGIMDRTKNWAKENSDVHRNRALQKGPGGLNLMRRAAQRMDRNQQYRKRAISAYEASKNANALEQDMDRYQPLYGVEKSAEMRQAAADNQMKAAVQNRLNTPNARLHIENVQMEAAKLALERATQATTSNMTEYQTGQVPATRQALATPDLTAAVRTMGIEHQELEVEKARATSAQHELQRHFSEAMEANVGDIQKRAGGIDPKGAQRALAAAFAAQSKAHAESISNAASILSHYNYGDDVISDIALGVQRPGLAINITDDIREAAIEKIAGGGNTDEILKLMSDLEINPSDDNQDFRQTFADTLLKNASKPKFAGAGIIAAMKQGNIPTVNGAPASGKARLDHYITETINADKMSSAELLVSHDRSYLETVLKTLKSNDSNLTISAQAKQSLLDEINLAKTDNRYSGRIGERGKALDGMEAILLGEGFTPKPPTPTPTTPTPPSP
jgi:hypothetical protein